MDHNVPTTPRGLPIADPIAAGRLKRCRKNCREFGVPLFDMDSPEQGIVHVIGPELGITQPGMTIVCGDSHTSTHGAFGSLAFGIGTSEVEHVLATQCLPQKKPKTMQVEVRGRLPEGVTAKDLALGIIGRIGTDGATGHVHRVHRRSGPRTLHGRPHDALQHEHRGWRSRRNDRARRDDFHLCRGIAALRRKRQDWDGADRILEARSRSDSGAQITTAWSKSMPRQLAPFVTWGTNPGDGGGGDGDAFPR